MAAEHDEVVQRGGLHVIGTERHEARRIDNQLRVGPDVRATREVRGSSSHLKMISCGVWWRPCQVLYGLGRRR